MFWAETLTEDHRYCTCQGAWISMRIINAQVDKKVLEVYMIPEDGTRNLVLSLRKGRNMPYFEELRFAAWDHVKIEVFDGEITMVGLSEDGIHRYRASNRFTPNCPFGGEEDWRPEKTRADVEIIPTRDIQMERTGIYGDRSPTQLLSAEELMQEEKSLSDRLSKLKRQLLEVKSDIVKLQTDKRNIHEEGEELNKIMNELNPLSFLEFFTFFL